MVNAFNKIEKIINITSFPVGAQGLRPEICLRPDNL
jgi:hypothetical protein